MTALETLKNQFAYDAWARAQYVAALKQLSDEEFTRNLGPGLDSLARKWTHVTDADMLWIGRIVEGVSPPAMPDNARFAKIADFFKHLMEIGHRRAQLIGGLKDTDLDRVVTYKNIRGQEFTQPLHELLQHLITHNMYHRGQLASCLRALGKQPPETDLVVWYRAVKGK